MKRVNAGKCLDLVRDQGVGGSNPLSPTIHCYNLTRTQWSLNPALCRCLCRNRLVCLPNCSYESPINPALSV
jgi:hypothetical protein